MLTPAKLPNNYIKRTLIDLRDGELVYTVPWAMVVDENLNCWLNVSFDYSYRAGGTVQMAVQREGGGYSVWIPKHEKYTPKYTDKVPNLLPVIAIYDWKDL